jgi:para-nitrobenzyl esterase
VVATHYGKLRGTQAPAEADVSVYLGIPYAGPPVGPRRWRAPEPPARWSGIRDASHPAPGCMQIVAPNRLPWTEEFMHQGAVSEDCLYLNVWTPARSTAERLPVLVFVHGGAFREGSGSLPLYDGTELAHKGLVVVTINYRLGALGFLVHPELERESPQHAAGDYGLADQVAALEWVRANIQAFGGDPQRVVLAGQSAGAMSVYLLTAAPRAAGLFQRAIVESGPGALASFGVPTLRASLQAFDDARKAGAKFAEQHGAKTLADLRALDASQLLVTGDAGIRFGPVVDGWLLPEDPDKVYDEHRQNDVPLLIGMMADEGSAFPGYDAAHAEAGRKQGIQALDRLLAERARTSREPAYLYYFEHPIPWPDAPQFGAFHSADLPYVFDNLARLPRPWSAADRSLAQAVSAYWVAFARSGSPNGPGLLAWPAYQPGSLRFMVFGEQAALRTLSAAN